MPARAKRCFLLLILACFAILPGLTLEVSAQDATLTPTPTLTPVIASITSPAPGQALQGKVLITGTTSIQEFQSYVLEFSYTGDSTNTWFFISDSTSPVSGGELAAWDTTTLTDGNYTLRLSVFTKTGLPQTATVSGLRIRNYSAVETDTPTPPAPTDTPQPGKTAPPTVTLTPTASPIPPTPTPLPPNPIQLTNPDLLFYLIRGILIAFALFAVFGLLIAIRRYFRRM